MKVVTLALLTLMLFGSSQSLYAQAKPKAAAPQLQFTINRECDGGACHFEIVSFNYSRNSSIAVGIGDPSLFYYFSVQITNGDTSKEYVYSDQPTEQFAEKENKKKVDATLNAFLLDVYKLGRYIVETDLDTRNKTFSETGKYSVLKSLRTYKAKSDSAAAAPIVKEPTSHTEWPEFGRGQKVGAFQFSRSRTLSYMGRPIAGVKFRSTVQKIAVSPVVLYGKYAICVTFDDLESTAYLLQLNKNSGRLLPLQGPPSVWASWSPAGNYAIMATYYEADMTLYSISLPSGSVRKFSLKLAQDGEEETANLENLSWVNNQVFRFRSTINCNPYTADDCSDREKILREFEVNANAATLAVSSERLR